MKMVAFCLVAAAALPGCAPVPDPVTDRGLAWARLGQTVYVDGPQVAPLNVLEDSRCPSDLQCVWAGRVRISARVDLGSGSQVRELTLGEPIDIADGKLELVAVEPAKTQAAIAADAYRFAFRFAGGL